MKRENSKDLKRIVIDKVSLSKSPIASDHKGCIEKPKIVSSIISPKTVRDNVARLQKIKKYGLAIDINALQAAKDYQNEINNEGTGPRKPLHKRKKLARKRRYGAHSKLNANKNINEKPSKANS